jgi:hypothetical protein
MANDCKQELLAGHLDNQHDLVSLQMPNAHHQSGIPIQGPEISNKTMRLVLRYASCLPHVHFTPEYEQEARTASIISKLKRTN